MSHEMTSSACIDSVFKFFEERLQKLLDRNDTDAEAGATALPDPADVNTDEQAVGFAESPNPVYPYEALSATGGLDLNSVEKSEIPNGTNQIGSGNGTKLNAQEGNRQHSAQNQEAGENERHSLTSSDSGNHATTNDVLAPEKASSGIKDKEDSASNVAPSRLVLQKIGAAPEIVGASPREEMVTSGNTNFVSEDEQWSLIDSIPNNDQGTYNNLNMPIHPQASGGQSPSVSNEGKVEHHNGSTKVNHRVEEDQYASGIANKGITDEEGTAHDGLKVVEDLIKLDT